MRPIHPIFSALFLAACFYAAPCTAATAKQTCNLPLSLQTELAKKYPNAHIVMLDDLGTYDRKLFQKLHGKHCPGIARVNFYGDGRRTWAIVLISGENPTRKAELITARETDMGWDFRTLDVTDGTPVVWREPPGIYEGMELKKISAKHPVIAFAGLESWEVVYIWTGEKAEKLQISD